MAMTPRELELLLRRLEGKVAQQFRSAIDRIRSDAQLQALTELVRGGNVDGLLAALGFDEAQFSPLAEAVREVFVSGGNASISELPTLSLRQQVRGNYNPQAATPVLRFGFDMRNPEADGWLRQNSTRLIRGIVTDQREVIRSTLQAGLTAGRNPRSTALDIVGRVGESGRRTGGVVGLTAPQAQYVLNAREQLASGDPRQMAEYFNRKRRDKRLDGIVKRAIAAGKPVSAADIEKITGRYADRLLQLRGETIGRTETLTAMSAGREEGYRQQVEAGKLLPENIECTWSDVNDRRTRHSHREMNGQKRQFGEPFQAPSGALMRFPGDTSLGAGPEETIQCRCSKLYRVNMTAEVLRGKEQVR